MSLLKEFQTNLCRFDKLNMTVVKRSGNYEFKQKEQK